MLCDARNDERKVLTLLVPLCDGGAG
ncbi:hypothetical protein SPHINGO8AM_130167 [Sphingomonas sp. 8AM]|nr:hypothetical protein SPHINGO8AM_130167 [Sphingomonas sp. 8AM]